MIVVGSCIGVGIFVIFGEIVVKFLYVGWVLIIWMIGGLVIFIGVFMFVELGGMYFKVGGIYVYFKEVYGKLLVFLYGWVILLVVNIGLLVVLGFIFVKYLIFYVLLMEVVQVWVVISIIGGLMIFNIFGINISQWIISVFIIIKLLVLMVVVVLVSMLCD